MYGKAILFMRYIRKFMTAVTDERQSTDRRRLSLELIAAHEQIYSVAVLDRFPRDFGGRWNSRSEVVAYSVLGRVHFGRNLPTAERTRRRP